MRGFWKGVAMGSIAVAALALYMGTPQRYPWESRRWERRRRTAWRSGVPWMGRQVHGLTTKGLGR